MNIGLTLVESALERFADGHELNPLPELAARALGHAKGPGTTQDVAAVLPDGLVSLLEEVDGLAHLDLLDGDVVLVPPKVGHGLDLGVELLERGMVIAVFGLLLVLGLPGERET